jgi:molecular chaperone DnaK
MAIGLEKAGGSMHVVFPRNAAIPNAKAIIATNSFDNQEELMIRIFQGDHPETMRNELLGEVTFSGVRKCRAGEVKLEITFDVSVEGILTMSAKDLDTGKQMKTTVKLGQETPT